MLEGTNRPVVSNPLKFLSLTTDGTYRAAKFYKRLFRDNKK